MYKQSFTNFIVLNVEMPILKISLQKKSKAI